jgi:hypothetical protein
MVSQDCLSLKSGGLEAMYLELLFPNDTTFETAIGRSALRFRTKRLDTVVAKLNAAKAALNPMSLWALYQALEDWRRHEPNEFANRGGTNGVAYRLWMETKQFLRNKFHKQTLTPDPAMPAGCPGVVLLGIYVPEGEGHVEICHGFAYRWAIAAGKILETPTSPATKDRLPNASGATMDPLLYPGGYASLQPVRVGGVMQIQAGDIVAMYVMPAAGHGAPQLGHSLIAESQTVLFSANNAGTFGVGTGRSRIDTTQNFGTFGGGAIHSGWVGNGHQWMRPDGAAVEVVFQRVP